MLLIWRERQWSFEPLKLNSAEAEAIEALGGSAWTTYSEFGQLFQRGHLRAKRAALWAVRRRDEPGLQFAEIDVMPTEIEVAYSPDEMVAIRRNILDTPDMDPEQRDYLLTIFAGDDEPASDPKDDSANNSPSNTTL